MLGQPPPLNLEKILKDTNPSQVVQEKEVFLDKSKIPYVLATIKQKILQSPPSKTGYFFEGIPEHEGSLFTWQAIVTEGESPNFYITHSTKLLGQGAQGEVYLAQNLKDTELAAVKIQQSGTMSFQDDVNNERENLQHLKRLKGTATVSVSKEITKAFTFMEYNSGENLLHFLYEMDNSVSKENPAHFKQKKHHHILLLSQIAVDILNQTLFFNFKKGMAHRDIKTENYIIRLNHGSVTVTLIDAGVAILFSKIQKGKEAHLTGTPGYIPPERANDAQRVSYNYRCDLYSTGIVLAEIFTKFNYQSALRVVLQSKRESGNHFNPYLTHEETVNLMKDYLGRHLEEELTNTPFHKLLMNIVHLICELTQQNPDKRPSLSELKSNVKDFSILVEQQRKIYELSNNKEMGTIPRKMSDPSAKSKPLLIRRASDLLGKMVHSKTPSPTGSPKDRVLNLSHPNSPHSPSSASSHSSQGSPHSSPNSGWSSPHEHHSPHGMEDLKLTPSREMSPKKTEEDLAIDRLAELVHELESSAERGEYAGNDKGTLLLFNRNIKAVLNLRNNPVDFQETLATVSKQLNSTTTPDGSVLHEKLALLKAATRKCLRPNQLSGAPPGPGST